jgi:hypothetical protein
METVGRTATSEELNAKYRGKLVRTTLPAIFPDEGPAVDEGTVEGFYDTPGEMVIISEEGEMWAVFPDTEIEVL